MHEEMDTIAQQGDRWIIYGVPPNVLTKKIPLALSWNMLLTEETELLLEYPIGSKQTAAYCASEGALILEKGLQWTPQTGLYQTCLALVDQHPLTFRFIEEPVKNEKLEGIHIEQGVQITFEEDVAALCRPPVSWEVFTLSKQAALFALTPDFEKLMGVSLLRELGLYDHQIKTVKTVLQRFRGRGLLRDEVGLGKTVEACLILLELIIMEICQHIAKEVYLASYGNPYAKQPR